MKIVIWTGPSWEPWGPRSLEIGIGGSETAVVHLSRQLATLGHEVVCYGEHQGHLGVHDGVRYENFRDMVDDPDSMEDGDVFISSRDKGVVRNLRPRARLKVLWMHDLHAGDDYQHEISDFDIVFCLSRFAARTFLRFYPEIPETKIVVTRNGIDPRLYDFDKTNLIREDQLVTTYSSSPNRGLELLLDLWPLVRSSATRELGREAKLNVCYGFDILRKMNAKNHVVVDWSTRLETRIHGMSDQGVSYLGRVGQSALAALQAASHLWLYPTAFKETSCITAMENVAAGAVPVATSLGALPETVPPGCGILLKPHNYEPKYQREFLQNIEQVMRPEIYWEMSDSGRKLREDMSWLDVAQEWQEIFENKIK